jgi:hypothetical protein
VDDDVRIVRAIGFPPTSHFFLFPHSPQRLLYRFFFVHAYVFHPLIPCRT